MYIIPYRLNGRVCASVATALQAANFYALKMSNKVVDLLRIAKLNSRILLIEIMMRTI